MEQKVLTVVTVNLYMQMRDGTHICPLVLLDVV